MANSGIRSWNKYTKAKLYIYFNLTISVRMKRNIEYIFKNVFHRPVMNKNYGRDDVLSTLNSKWKSRATEKRTKNWKIQLSLVERFPTYADKMFALKYVIQFYISKRTI